MPEGVLPPYARLALAVDAGARWTGEFLVDGPVESGTWAAAGVELGQRRTPEGLVLSVTVPADRADAFSLALIARAVTAGTRPGPIDPTLLEDYAE